MLLAVVVVVAATVAAAAAAALRRAIDDDESFAAATTLLEEDEETSEVAERLSTTSLAVLAVVAVADGITVFGTASNDASSTLLSATLVLVAQRSCNLSLVSLFASSSCLVLFF
jgi:hypothetical protein